MRGEKGNTGLERMTGFASLVGHGLVGEGGEDMGSFFVKFLIRHWDTLSQIPL